MEFIFHFTLPLAVIACYLVWFEWHIERAAFGVRLRNYARILLPLVRGLGSVLVPFLVPYATAHAFPDLVRGVFILPAKRLTDAALPPPDLKWMLYSLPVAALLSAGLLRGRRAVIVGVRPERTSQSSYMGISPEHSTEPARQGSERLALYGDLTAASDRAHATGR